MSHHQRGHGLGTVAVGGVFSFELVRNGEVIDTWHEHNLVTTEGLNHLLNVAFKAGTQSGTWYVGLFEGNYTPVAGDTAATFVAAATESTAYDETSRQLWNTDAVSAGVVNNGTNKAIFTISATKTLYGMFLTSASAKSATSGTLFSATRFSSARNVLDNDELRVTYTLTATSA